MMYEHSIAPFYSQPGQASLEHKANVTPPISRVLAKGSVDPGDSGLQLTHTAPQRSDLRNSLSQEEIVLRSPRMWVVSVP